MAQSVEHHLGKVEVPGSNPGNSSTKQIHRKRLTKHCNNVILNFGECGNGSMVEQ